MTLLVLPKTYVFAVSFHFLLLFPNTHAFSGNYHTGVIPISRDFFVDTLCKQFVQLSLYCLPCRYISKAPNNFHFNMSPLSSIYDSVEQLAD